MNLTGILEMEDDYHVKARVTSWRKKDLKSEWRKKL